MPTAISVFQWATGNVGAQSVRAVVGDPRFELLGAFVYSPDKVGQDVGTLCGIEPIGVSATGNVNDVLRSGADCVLYNALGETNDPAQGLEDICTILAAGSNVVSTAVSTHVHPLALSEEDRARLEEACAAGGSTFHSTGINPGFAFDLLPLNLSVLANRIERIDVLELVDMSAYSSANIVRDMIGMGADPEVEVPMDLLTDFRWSPYLPCIQLLSDAYGLDVDDFAIAHEKAVTEVAIEMPWGKVEAGTVAARRVLMRASQGGHCRVSYDMVWRVSDSVAPAWPNGAAHYEVVIHGDPTLRARLDIASKSGRGTSAATALHAVNAVRAVCAAPPGICTRLDLPIQFGGYIPVAPAPAHKEESGL